MIKKVYKIIKLVLVVFIFWPVNSFAEFAENWDEDSFFAQELPEKRWKGSVEGGSTLIKGNTDQESTYGKANIKYKKEKYSNLFKTRLENTKTDKVRVKERYDVNDTLRYSYANGNFSLIELEYIDDRYGGYDYRISESIGYGRKFIEDEEINFSVQGSAGSRQVKFTDGDKEDSWLVRIGGDLSWEIDNDIEFKQHLDISFDKETEITRSDTSLKIKMTSVSDSLYFTLSYFLERKSNTSSPEIKNTDSTLMLMFGCDF